MYPLAFMAIKNTRGAELLIVDSLRYAHHVQEKGQLLLPCILGKLTQLNKILVSVQLKS